MKGIKSSVLISTWSPPHTTGVDPRKQPLLMCTICPGYQVSNNGDQLTYKSSCSLRWETLSPTVVRLLENKCCHK
jgi:hypothetical protein